MKIRTNLFGNDAKNVLLSVMGQLSDGIWENSRQMEKYWKNTEITTDGATGEIIIDTCEYYFNEPTETYIKKWFAQKAKQVVKREQEWSNPSIKWDRNDTTKLDYMYDHFHNWKSPERKDPTVADVYKVYDRLLERNI